MTLFNANYMNYEMIAPHTGKLATVTLFGGKTYHGQILEVHKDGILFHSDNPGFLFLPFLALAALTLTIPFAYAAGAASSRRHPYPYGYYPY
ncbi:MAG: hypothetical protein PHZ11_00250 [Desulfitobacteriaceae bacterium]|nr:hypothetical protein [Desulfitobacteriaceae bacterium]MDD4345330.1 hypothetical protein [Desulfitobacteriaceae bacterium]MDD4400347.1 hypothetical protein [Desulfitobacteriaceae bacterium]